MDQQQAAEVLRNLDQRTRRMEQILPDLPTRAEMHEAIQAAFAPLATREEMREAIDTSIQAAIAPLATREEMREAIDTSIQAAIAPLATRQELLQGLADLRDELRRHMDVWAEHLSGTAKMAIEGVQIVDDKYERRYEDLRQQMAAFLEHNAEYRVASGRTFEELRQRIADLIETEAQYHVGPRKTYEELQGYWREYVKTHTKEHAENAKAVAKLRGRVEKIEAKPPRKRKAS